MSRWLCRTFVWVVAVACVGCALTHATSELVPEPFAEEALGAVGPHLHTSVYLAPDGQEAFLTVQDPRTLQLTILVMERKAGAWNEPRAASFSGAYDDNCAAFSADGRRLYFTSNRPVDGEGAASKWPSVWTVERVGRDWSEPRHVGSAMDVDRDEGTLYFGAELPGGQGGSDVHRIRFVEGRYGEPENVGAPINTAADEYVALAAPEERFLIVYRYDRVDKSQSGLYASFAQLDGTWSEPAFLDDRLGIEWGFDASLSPDGETLFLLDRGVGVYRVDRAVLDSFRPA
jgi:hypothetical protein